MTTGKYDLEAFRQRARQGDGRPRRFDPREKRNVDRCYGPITYQELYAWGLYDDLAAAHPGRLPEIRYIDNTWYAGDDTYRIGRASTYSELLAQLEDGDFDPQPLEAAGVQLPLPAGGRAAWARVLFGRRAVECEWSDDPGRFPVDLPPVAYTETLYEAPRDLLERFLAASGWPVRLGAWAAGPAPVATGPYATGRYAGAAELLGRPAPPGAGPAEVLFRATLEAVAAAFPGRLAAGRVGAVARRRLVLLAGAGGRLRLVFHDDRVECDTFEPSPSFEYAHPDMIARLEGVLATHDWAVQVGP